MNLFELHVRNRYCGSVCTHFLPGVACCLCGVVTVRDPPTVGEEKRGVEVGIGDREEGWTEDEVRGDAWGISKTGPAAVVLVPGMKMQKG